MPEPRKVSKSSSKPPVLNGCGGIRMSHSECTVCGLTGTHEEMMSHAIVPCDVLLRQLKTKIRSMSYGVKLSLFRHLSKELNYVILYEAVAQGPITLELMDSCVVIYFLHPHSVWLARKILREIFSHTSIEQVRNIMNFKKLSAWELWGELITEQQNAEKCEWTTGMWNNEQDIEADLNEARAKLYTSRIIT